MSRSAYDGGSARHGRHERNSHYTADETGLWSRFQSRDPSTAQGGVVVVSDAVAFLANVATTFQSGKTVGEARLRGCTASTSEGSDGIVAPRRVHLTAAVTRRSLLFERQVPLVPVALTVSCPPSAREPVFNVIA